ncbi:CusA/CzcA family heavy metal efflux RND transporter [Prolixibacteraceae bacterium JC049]|nr:CusA/CzcA family heavy metal efflux RND transporter [Prolixibacteraceae bacterium JC049]
MLDRIIRFSIDNKLIVGLFIVALIAWGTYSLSRLPIDAVPDITDNQVMIITSTPSLAAQEVEQLVTFPIEQTMVTIPEIDQMRSFSRFGLSIVTVVFKEHVDLYWARQQVQERLTLAAKEIPDDVGVPEMAPVTTGLGEIYQYVVHTAPGFEDKYDAIELRTIQDWIIKRQLLGTPGVADVSGFGGFVKQYQVAIEPDKLKSMNVSIDDIFQALERNNQNTGGAYIDKNPYSYFIRTEGLVKNIDDIERIVVKHTNDGVPILVRDIAAVQFGHGARYGAATRNGEGEVVTGIVMMLKGANSSEVIDNVKEKIEQIKKTLPEGVIIEPYLDRKKLVDGAIGTVAKNLAEGALIVIFVLILFLGNIRGGLVVASVIPLAMLFAFAMMRLFNVSGNLMSLGAIDFGLIVDGTVIIVEAVMHGIQTGKKRYPGILKLTQKQMNDEVYRSSSKIRTSAAFGEIIILIVYLPLWALTGVEGKMFTPMAQTVSFAILGAFILSLTYVPMMSALALSKKVEHKRNFSDRMMDFFQRIYDPVIELTLKNKRKVLLMAVAMFVMALVTFNKMGAEFIPQLDEGDFAVETRVPVGSSIQQSIEVSQKAQTIILSQFSEVKQIVSKVGSGEIPTDPMPIEAGDMMIVLKPRKEWENASSREELAEKMLQALSVIPNATFSFQQPIQMRFNELLTGAKQDVVIKIYGEDLDVLASLSKQVGKKIAKIDGVNDLYIEEITGLPQIQVKMKRDKIAEYGLDIQDINRAIEIGFAGKTTGLVYEGERRFDLVVRLAQEARADIRDVQNLFVETENGEQIPLNEVAEVVYEPGPIQIQRDDAKRRVTIGYNVRGRDVKSTVNDIRGILDRDMKMPSGYYITYGGQFENLQAATKRLAIALPIALLMILVLLYFTFHSIKQSLLIFTAIPLSAIGGVFALYVRDMPFSISAGVGFIALFGVAVLNGIVLIAEFNRLAENGVTDIYERIRKGTRVRLRPVLMTAMVASLGFLPMAISTTAGAEVQRPLATVVIGGLITATLLTLIVLPVLYIFFSKKKKGNVVPVKKAVIVLVLLGCTGVINAQVRRTVTIEQAINEALVNNPQIKAGELTIDKKEQEKKAAWSMGKTAIRYGSGEISNPGVTDNSIEISQNLQLPGVYSAKSRLGQANIEEAESGQAIRKTALVKQVKESYWQLVYVNQKISVLQKQDSLFNQLSSASNARYESGESTHLESVTSNVKWMQVRNEMEQLKGDLLILSRRLQTLLATDDEIVVADSKLPLRKLNAEELNVLENSSLKYFQSKEKVARMETKVEKGKALPEILLGVNSQTYKNTNGYKNGKRFNSFSIGLAIPILPNGNRARVRAARKQEMIAQSESHWNTMEVKNQFKALLLQYEKLSKSLNYYQNSALNKADIVIENSQKAFRSGDISYSQYLQNLTLSNDIQLEYLEKLLEYNVVIVAIDAITGNI